MNGWDARAGRDVRDERRAQEAGATRGVVRCKGCGRIIGERDGRRVVIRHKGRVVRCFVPCEVTCDNPACRAVNALCEETKNQSPGNKERGE